MRYEKPPIYQAIQEYLSTRPVPYHMPGHKLGKGIPAEFLQHLERLDLTEIPGTDNLHSPEGPIKEAQELAARAFGAKVTRFLVNGSTTGIHAMILTLCKPGDKLLVARDCHRSVIGGMMLAGVEPAYIGPVIDPRCGAACGVTPQAVEDALAAHPDAVGVLITRPTYYGICSDIEAIARLVHSKGKILAVDEAHGTHLKFHPRLPVCAMDAGADICVQSAHKTLPALTQGAYLHVGSARIDLQKLDFYLRTLQTTSPSYILMAFLDIAREIMEKTGREMLDTLLDLICESRVRAAGSAASPEFLCLRGSSPCGDSFYGSSLFQTDDTRIVASFINRGITGFQAEARLREEFAIQVEMADLLNVVCIATVADDRESITRLFQALELSGSRVGEAEKLKLPDFLFREQPIRALSMREVLQAHTRRIPLHSSAGSVSADILAPYPPGIPVVCPGERVTDGAVGFLAGVLEAGGKVGGVNEKLEISVIK